MSYLSKAQRAQVFAMREIMDRVIAGIPMASEAEFNASASAINENAAAIRIWKPGTADAPKSYAREDIRIDPTDGAPYWALVTHTSYAGAELQPSLSPTVWTHCHGTSPETARAFVAEGHNPYMTGHYCVENGVVARCKQDNVVHAPSVLPSAWEIVA